MANFNTPSTIDKNQQGIELRKHAIELAKGDINILPFTEGVPVAFKNQLYNEGLGANILRLLDTTSINIMEWANLINPDQQKYLQEISNKEYKDQETKFRNAMKYVGTGANIVGTAAGGLVDPAELALAAVPVAGPIAKGASAASKIYKVSKFTTKLIPANKWVRSAIAIGTDITAQSVARETYTTYQMQQFGSQKTWEEARSNVVGELAFGGMLYGAGKGIVKLKNVPANLTNKAVKYFNERTTNKIQTNLLQEPGVRNFITQYGDDSIQFKDTQATLYDDASIYITSNFEGVQRDALLSDLDLGRKLGRKAFITPDNKVFVQYNKHSDISEVRSLLNEEFMHNELSSALDEVDYETIVTGLPNKDVNMLKQYQDTNNISNTKDALEEYIIENILDINDPIVKKVSKAYKKIHGENLTDASIARRYLDSEIDKSLGEIEGVEGIETVRGLRFSNVAAESKLGKLLAQGETKDTLAELGGILESRGLDVDTLADSNLGQMLDFMLVDPKVSPRMLKIRFAEYLDKVVYSHVDASIKFSKGQIMSRFEKDANEYINSSAYIKELQDPNNKRIVMELLSHNNLEELDIDKLKLPEDLKLDKTRDAALRALLKSVKTALIPLVDPKLVKTVFNIDNMLSTKSIKQYYASLKDRSRLVGPDGKVIDLDNTNNLINLVREDLEAIIPGQKMRTHIPEFLEELKSTVFKREYAARTAGNGKLISTLKYVRSNNPGQMHALSQYLSKLTEPRDTIRILLDLNARSATDDMLNKMLASEKLPFESPSRAAELAAINKDIVEVKENINARQAAGKPTSKLNEKLDRFAEQKKEHLSFKQEADLNSRGTVDESINILREYMLTRGVGTDDVKLTTANMKKIADDWFALVTKSHIQPDQLGSVLSTFRKIKQVMNPVLLANVVWSQINDYVNIYRQYARTSLNTAGKRRVEAGFKTAVDMLKFFESLVTRPVKGLSKNEKFAQEMGIIEITNLNDMFETRYDFDNILDPNVSADKLANVSYKVAAYATGSERMNRVNRAQLTKYGFEQWNSIVKFLQKGNSLEDLPSELRNELRLIGITQDADIKSLKPIGKPGAIQTQVRKDFPGAAVDDSITLENILKNDEANAFITRVVDGGVVKAGIREGRRLGAAERGGVKGEMFYYIAWLKNTALATMDRHYNEVFFNPYASRAQKTAVAGEYLGLSIIIGMMAYYAKALSTGNKTESFVDKKGDVNYKAFFAATQMAVPIGVSDIISSGLYEDFDLVQLAGNPLLDKVSSVAEIAKNAATSNKKHAGKIGLQKLAIEAARVAAPTSYGIRNFVVQELLNWFESMKSGRKWVKSKKRRLKKEIRKEGGILWEHTGKKHTKPVPTLIKEALTD